MKSNFVLICSMMIQLLFGITQTVQSRTVSLAGLEGNYAQYKVIEFNFNVTSPDVSNPFADVDIQGTFTSPSNDVVHVRGFCDSYNGTLHKLRFTPSETGSYSFSIVFKDTHGQKTFTGNFSVTNTNAGNGFIITDPDYTNAFMFSNGEHPFIFSKTAWLIGGVTQTNYRAFIDKMVPRKENCIRFALEFDFSSAEPFIDVWPWQGTRSNPDYTRYDINFWKKIDEIIKYAADRNIYSEVCFFTLMRTNLDWNYAEPYLDYALARLASNPNVILFQTNNEFQPDRDDKDYVVDIANFVHANDPYGHLVAPAHKSTTDAAWADESWVDVAINHWAKHNQHSLAQIREIAQTIKQYNKPAWCDETAREIRHSNNCAEHRRKQYWTWSIAGVYTCFHSYEGSEGIVDVSYNGPGYEYVPYLRPFWERTEFWKMQPNESIIRNDPASMYEWALASDDEIVIYMVNGPDNTLEAWDIPDNYTYSNGIRVALDAGKYDVQFYNPSNGNYYSNSEINDLDGGGNILIDFPTFNQDLVIYIKKQPEAVATEADFSAQPRSGFMPLQVQFTDLSTNANSWDWDFGDGSSHSYAQNPQHTYTQPGSYTVTLAVSGGGGSDTKTLSGYIQVTEKYVQFTNVTEAVNVKGFSSVGYGRAAAFADLNRDGFQDFAVSNAGGSESTLDQLYINDGDGQFNNEAVTRNIEDSGYTHSVVFADLNNDGYQDAYFANQPIGVNIQAGKNRIYRNEGSGFFTDVTEGFGIPDNYSYSRGAIALDMNNDGYLDLYTVNWGSQNETYINDGTGKMNRSDRGADGPVGDVTAQQGVTAADVDNDGDIDIYVCQRDAENLLYINDGTGNFDDDAADRGVNVDGLSHGATFADIDIDGDMDLFVVNYSSSGSADLPLLSVFINNGNGFFTDKSAEYNIAISGYTAAIGDMDNDGFPDLLLVRNDESEPDVTPQLLLNDGTGKFNEINEIGLDNGGSDARAGALADYDNDGDLDIYITCAKSWNIMYRNDLINDYHYIDVLCEGPKGDYGGFGSKVSVFESGHLGDANYLIGYQEAVSNFGYLSQNQTALHFGLMNRTACDIRLVLTNGDILDYTGVQADQVFKVDAYQALTAPIILHAAVHDDDNIKFTWTNVSNASGYNVYRGTDPYFEPDYESGSNRVASGVTDQDASMPNVQWIDTDPVVGNTSVNYFYRITALRNGEESSATLSYGEFDYALLTTETTDFNEIALPLFVESITTANDLLSYIPSCNSVAMWSAELQDYVQYVPGFEPSNFTIEMGNPYYVNMLEDQVLTILGKVVTPVFNLITTPTTDFNEIALPFDKASLATSADLANDIPNCNSVAKWDTEIQGYWQYVPGLIHTNFDIKAGYPYYINVTAPTSWPQRAFSKAKATELVVKTNSVSKAPHAIWGELSDTQVHHFSAYLSHQPDHVLNETSPGCFMTTENWMVQVGNFENGWSPDQVLIIEFFDESNTLLNTIEHTLSSNAVDFVGALDIVDIPDHYGLDQNYPNPFNPTTVIQYQLPEQSHVLIEIYNTRGQRVRTLINQGKAAGRYSVEWNGCDDFGRQAASGTYLFMMKAGTFHKVQKAVLLK